MGEDREREGRAATVSPESRTRAERTAVNRVRETQAAWRKRRESPNGGKGAWMRVTYTLPRAQAKEKAREFLSRFPKAAYWSEVESWRVLPGDVIEFTMRRLPSAD